MRKETGIPQEKFCDQIRFRFLLKASEKLRNFEVLFGLLSYFVCDVNTNVFRTTLCLNCITLITEDPSAHVGTRNPGEFTTLIQLLRHVFDLEKI